MILSDRRPEVLRSLQTELLRTGLKREIVRKEEKDQIPEVPPPDTLEVARDEIQDLQASRYKQPRKKYLREKMEKKFEKEAWRAMKKTETTMPKEVLKALCKGRHDVNSLADLMEKRFPDVGRGLIKTRLFPVLWTAKKAIPEFIKSEKVKRGAQTVNVWWADVAKQTTNLEEEMEKLYRLYLMRQRGVKVRKPAKEKPKGLPDRAAEKPKTGLGDALRKAVQEYLGVKVEVTGRIEIVFRME